MEKTHEKQIELNPEFKRAFELMENSGKSVFVTGKAGTGKSTLLKYFRENTGKEVVVLAPTGVAALNVEGQTIHSFFKFNIDITPAKVKKVSELQRELYENVDAIVIDEVSMVRADLMDCVDKFLRLNGKKRSEPFGGVQMIFIGDLYQLPPVVASREKEVFQTHYASQYFFDSAAWKAIEVEFVELEKIYRQKDDKFIQLLNAVRNNSITDVQINQLNKRLNPNFSPPAGDFCINLTTTNQMANEENQRQLAKTPGKLSTFIGKVKGKFEQKDLPTEIKLDMKKGCQVMMLNNDAGGRWVNGTVGKIRDIQRSGDDEDDIDIISVLTSDGRKVNVTPHTWKMYQTFYNKEKQALDSETKGSFTQYPLRLAWAVTIHKSQGKTFDNVVIDTGNGTFSHGQVYVALSRCTSFEGMVLKKPISKKHIWMDWKIVKFLTNFQYQRSEEQCSLGDKLEIIQNAIANKSSLDMVYLKGSDEKSKRTVKPLEVGEMEYMNKKYTGMRAYCYKRQDERTFRVDRILELNVKQK